MFQMFYAETTSGNKTLLRVFTRAVIKLNETFFDVVVVK